MLRNAGFCMKNFNFFSRRYTPGPPQQEGRPLTAPPQHGLWPCAGKRGAAPGSSVQNLVLFHPNVHYRSTRMRRNVSTPTVNAALFVFLCDGFCRMLRMESCRQSARVLMCYRPKPQQQPSPPTSSVSSASGTSSGNCMMCTTEPVGVVFHPCGHSVACLECSSRMKQCFRCHGRIQEKVRIQIVRPSTASKCMNCDAEPVGVTFRPCGHRVVCVECSRRMKLCIQCHQTIQEKVL